MALATPVVLYGVNGGALAALVPGTPVTVATGVLLQLELQSNAGVVACTYTIGGPGTTLDGQSFPAYGPSFSIVQQLPITPTTYTIRCSVTDGENVTSTTVTILCTSAGIVVSPAPLIGQVPVSNGAGAFVPQGHKPVHHFASYGASTVDNLNAARFEAMLADAAADGLDCYCPPGQYGTNRPIFWTQSRVRVGGPKCFGISDPNAFQLKPVYTISATDWYGPTIVMGAETPEPLWVGPDAHGMYGLPLGTPVGANEPAYINLSALDALSLKGVGAIAVDMKYFHPAGGNAGQQFDMFFAGGGSVAPNVVYTLYFFTAGSDQIRLFATTAVGGLLNVLSTTGNKLNQNAWNDIRVSYDGTSWRIFINGILDTTQTGHTGTLTVDPFFRCFVGSDSAGTWLSDGNGDSPAGGSVGQPGAAIGDFMISFGGTPVTNTGNYSPANRYVRDDVSSWTPPGASPTHCTGILINFDVANRASTVCGHTGWIIAQSNVGRSPQLPRNPGNTVWLSCGGRAQTFCPFNALHDVIIQGTIGLYASVCNFITLDDVFCDGYAIGCALTAFSYYAKIRGGSYDARLSVGSAGLYTGDYWALACLSEGAHVTRVEVSGGNMAIAGSGCFITPYVDISGYFAVAISNNSISTLVDAHIYNEGNNTGLLALLAVVGSGALSCVSALIGSVGSSVPNGVSVYGGGAIALKEVAFSSGLTNCISFVGASLPTPVSTTSPVEVSGISPATPWLDAANPGLLVFPQNRGISPVATSADANRTVTDHEFFAGYTIKLTGAHWTTGRNLVLPYVIEGDERIVHNTEAQTLTIKPGSVTVTSGSYARVIADGTNWVTSP